TGTWDFPWLEACTMPTVCSAAVAPGLTAAGVFRLTCVTAVAAGFEAESRLQPLTSAAADSSSRAQLIQVFWTVMFLSLPNTSPITTRRTSQLQGWLEHRRQLVLQRAVMLFPVARLRKPGKSLR